MLNFILLGLVVLGLVLVYFKYKSNPAPKIESLYTDALNAMVRSDRKLALKLLRDVVRQDSDHVTAYLQMGNILRDNQAEQAVKIHQSLTVRPNLGKELQAEIHQALALDYHALGHLVRAQKEAEQCLRIDKKNMWALQFLLEIAEKNHDWKTASKWAKIVQKQGENKDLFQMAQYKVYEGLDKMESGDKSGAKALFQKAVKDTPTFGTPYFYLGDMYAESRDLVKATENWEQYAHLMPEESGKVFAKIESALFDLGRYSEVENFYRRILDENPNNMEAVAKLANVLEEKGEHNAALSLLEKSLDSENTNIHGLLMKLKLSLYGSTPVELSHQIDQIISQVTRK
ncbi:MAG: tetratricopeptide repeat protein [Candidatus Marinimicrobia bacterium]|nr:tetratricopeptide repeat protein [Candidatus Neomarinimicrobiota bacterium]MBT3496615.1 tetratricopeptide repeat protein [Candidatus Neomarinimicrobiota bacterium]MBT3692923.1 tetratricopeptide repeat protein [Candidatus Neomarinimicrobiota bacterium]MBT3731695.1 tetratricopeptide repeat protein [Candidatus Neomarinimicrobiota bacterium]MBT4177625.1 tetratricopeptide repeat protein [Candidatus Neomarinimicrobiota bacterium]